MSTFVQTKSQCPNVFSFYYHSLQFKNLKLFCKEIKQNSDQAINRLAFFQDKRPLSKSLCHASTKVPLQSNVENLMYNIAHTLFEVLLNRKTTNILFVVCTSVETGVFLKIWLVFLLRTWYPPPRAPYVGFLLCYEA